MCDLPRYAEPVSKHGSHIWRTDMIMIVKREREKRMGSADSRRMGPKSIAWGRGSHAGELTDDDSRRQVTIEKVPV